MSSAQSHQQREGTWEQLKEALVDSKVPKLSLELALKKGSC